MGVENVACPKCGREAIVTVPIGKRLLGVTATFVNYSRMKAGSYSVGKCASCKQQF